MLYSLAQPLTERTKWQIKTWQLFFLVLLLNILLMWLFNRFILTREVYYNLFSELMEASRIDEYFDFLKKASFWGYVAAPIILLLKITFISLLIQMPLLLMLIEIPFNYIFRIVTWASLLMVVSGYIRWLWLFNMEPQYITKNALNMVPFSINQFINASKYTELAYVNLGRFNIFELGWCYILYRGLIRTEKIKKGSAALYITLLWILLFLFQWGLSAYFQGVNG